MGFMAFRILAMQVRGEQHRTDADEGAWHQVRMAFLRRR